MNSVFKYGLVFLGGLVVGALGATAAKRGSLNLKPLATDLISRGMDVKERMARFDLKPDRADVIVPAGEIFVNVAGALHSDYVLVPALGLADGIVERLYMEFNSWK